MQQTATQYVAGNVFSRKGLKELTKQQERFCYHICGGVSIPDACKAVGTTIQQGKEWVANPLIRDVIDGFYEKNINTVAITRDKLSMMMLESYYKAGNTMEEISALREIGKLQGLYAPELQQVTVTVDNPAKIRSVDDATLAKMAGLDDPNVIDADYTEV